MTCTSTFSVSVPVCVCVLELYCGLEAPGLGFANSKLDLRSPTSKQTVKALSKNLVNFGISKEIAVCPL